MTLTFSDFFGAKGFREATFRGVAFFAPRALETAIFFLAAALALEVGLALEVTRFFDAFRGAGLFGVARLAFGRFAFATTRRLAADFDEVRPEDARDVERLSPFETALMRLQIEGLKRVDVSRRCGGRLT